MRIRHSKTPRVRDVRTLGPTPRRLAAARKAIDRERGVGTLFVDAPAMTPEERIARFDAGQLESERELRDRRARLWRTARARLLALPADRRRLLLEWWNGTDCPGDPSYLLGYIDQEERGQFDPAARLAELRRCRRLGFEKWGHLPDYEWLPIGDPATDEPDPRKT
jgi:hypothetical protein